ncbi:hypothetical protein MO973_20750 [Paenibacillus sp. TRM 82003]|nr:hypothetical protein [Paenibacillus sp. TRM 82003]
MNMFLILALFGYIIYILIIRPIIISAKYKELKVELPLNENLDHVTLLERLREKGFSYPELKNMRHNESGQVVIEGKYTSHPLEINGQMLYVGKGMKGDEQKKANCILEAAIIAHYLSKFFNPNAPVDAYKEYEKFRKRRKQPVLVTAGIFILFLIAFAFQAGEELTPQLQSNNISSSYLSQYSNTKTIGDTFEAFFGDPKWKSYEQGIQKYVDFQGTLTVDNEPAVSVITFSVSGEKFMVESVKIDNQVLNSLEVEAFFQTVYSEDSEDHVIEASHDLKESQNTSSQEIVESEPTELTQGIGLPNSLSDGKIEGISIALGDDASLITEKLGTPEDEGIWGGSYYYLYPDSTFFLDNISPDSGVVSSIAIRSNNPYFDNLLGKSFQEIQEIIGEEGVVGENEMEGDYVLTYNVGDHLLIFNAPSQDAPSTSVQLIGWREY